MPGSMLRYIISLFLLVLFAQKELQAQNMQKEANVWYMGEYIGIDFNSGTAVPLNDGQISTDEGVATISDANGNLLFYTDGRTIRNRLHQLMPNGTGLFGNISATQSAVIVPKVGDPDRYYVFTVDAVQFVFSPATFTPTKGINYSVVNMTLDNGNGDVELKNVPLTGNSVEKITAVRHCNNKDVWVLGHDTASNGYYAFLVTAAGVNATPVISHTGSVLPGLPRVTTPRIDSSFLGCLKASPDGKKIAAAHWNVNVDVSDFDNATGIVSNTISLHPPTEPYCLSYGVEFSPDSKLLYSTVRYNPTNAFSRSELQQNDLTLGSPAAVIASRQIISTLFDPGEKYGALQIAPDGKMYMALNGLKYLAAVNDPNVYGTGCNFISNAIQWTGASQRSRFGLPTFTQSYFYPLDSFTHTVSCQTLTGTFNYLPASNVVSVKWDFGDPASGANNTSTQNNTTHVFSAPGNYMVQLIKFTNCGTDTIKKTVSTDAININLGNDTLVCGSTSLLLNAAGVGSTNHFLWQDGSTNPTFTATAPGLYWVEATNSAGCLKRDSINVDFKPMPVYNLGADLAICSGDTLTFNATVTGATSYTWNTGAVTPSIKAFLQGMYWCDVKKDGCTFRDTVAITALKPAPVVNLGNDITVCQGVPVTLDATNPNAVYQWQDGAATPVYNPTLNGLYWVEVTNTTSGCKKRDSINVAFTSAPVFNLGIDTAICAADTIVLNAAVNGATNYLWSNGAATATIKAYQAGLYWCEVSRGTCSFRDSLIITAVKPSPLVNLGADQTVCEGTIITLNATYPGATYQWQDGNANPIYTVKQQGIYTVKLDLNGCKRSDTVKINYNLKPVFTLGPDQLICPTNTITLAPVLDPSWQLLWQDGTRAATYNITQTGTYSLTATNTCGSTTDAIQITKGICSIYIPNAFTPNGDARNDEFKVFGTDLVTTFNLKIFNRYGQVVFETADKNKGWDGRLNGQPSPGGGFVYFLTYKESTDPQPKQLKGSFILIR
ncbi:gliding motility-associated C-terminal domain-containing protein [Ferruginibacter sp.]